MKPNTGSQRPYSPNFIHSFYAWLDRLPVPIWISFILLFFIIGLTQHLVAWSKGMLAAGQFNFDLGTAGYWLIGGLLFGLYVLKGAAQALDEFRPLLNVTEDEYAQLKYKFVTIPNGWGTFLFLVGLPMGAMSGFSDMAVAPAVDYAFPQLRIGIWMAASAIFIVFIYQVIRQLRQISAFYAMPKQIDIFNPRPLYGFSRYTAILGITFFFYEGVIPLLLDPTAFASKAVYNTSLTFIPLMLLMFYFPLSGAHRRLVAEKERLLQDANNSIATLLEQIHVAAFEQKNYADVGGIRTVISALREQKESIQGLSTWPWRTGTLTGLLSSLFLPIFLMLVRELILRLMGG